jgi:hypothetical protein
MPGHERKPPAVVSKPVNPSEGRLPYSRREGGLREKIFYYYPLKRIVKGVAKKKSSRLSSFLPGQGTWKVRNHPDQGENLSLLSTDW